MALLGSLVLMFVIGYGITLDVENLSYAVLDRDRTAGEPELRAEPVGLALFHRTPAIVMRPTSIAACAAASCRWPSRSAGLRARHAARAPVQIGAWIDGAMPQRAETIRGYVGGLHQKWLAQQLARARHIPAADGQHGDALYRYNPDVKSLPAMVPAVIALLLLMLPAMLTALAVVREKSWDPSSTCTSRP